MKNSLLVTLPALALFLASCSGVMQVCRGLASAESVAASAPVIKAFQNHLASTKPTSDSGKYLSDYRHYDIAITSSDSYFEYEFIPQNSGKNFKGGGAFYRVNRHTGKIEETKYMK